MSGLDSIFFLVVILWEGRIEPGAVGRFFFPLEAAAVAPVPAVEVVDVQEFVQAGLLLVRVGLGRVRVVGIDAFFPQLRRDGGDGS